ncbi:zf-HC2 domain-containing protein [Thermoactinospora rubra]|uniref:zf-HC2 domain-containing protein n=1 Tax=Thermoactinospora rubra TaxID=1088767 RepID=UPI000A116ED8|nr:zf-HC2 domain-containing protein [Thermoactinospora rubra]
MTGDTHYDLEVLAELAEGLLDADTARQVREHLAVCDPCGERLADLAAVREVLAAIPTPAMPMGVALRIDKALEAERAGVAVMSSPEPPARLGVVADDGTVVPARTRRRRTARRWAMPAAAAAAAAAVMGGVTLSTLNNSATVVAASPSASASAQSQAARAYDLTESDHNFSDGDLKEPLNEYLGPAKITQPVAETENQVSKCVDAVENRSKLKPFAVHQALYNGSEALIMASWRNEAAKQIRIDIVEPFHCKPLRKAAVGRW